MLLDVLPALVCPACPAERETALAQVSDSAGPPGAGVGCAHGHRFDVARQGYLNLASARTPPAGRSGAGLRARAPANADDTAMVEARTAFAAGGHYRPLLTRVAELAEPGGPAEHTGHTGHAGHAGHAGHDRTGSLPAGAGALIVDAGAGTGHFLAGVLDRTDHAVGLAVDLSKPAIRRAAAAHRRIGAIVADVWQRLPIRSGAAAVVLNVFAPRNGPEFARILRPDGRLVVATPTPRHLVELRERLVPLGVLGVDDAKSARLADRLTGHFEAVDRELCEFALELDATEAGSLIMMGPNAHHLDRDALQARLATSPGRLRITASVELSRWRRR